VAKSNLLVENAIREATSKRLPALDVGDRDIGATSKKK